MSVSQAIFGSFGLAKESSFGVTTAPTDFLQITGETFSDENQFIPFTGIRNTGSEREPLPGRFSAGGDFTVESDALNSGLALAAMFGSETVTQLNSTVAYRHVFKFAQNPPSLSVTIDRVADATRYIGTMLTSMRVAMANNAALPITFSGQSKTVAIVTAPVASYTEPTPFAFPQCTVKFDGVANAVIENINLTVNNNNYTDNWTLGSGRTRREIPPQMRTVELTLDLLFEDDTEYQRFLGNTTATAPQSTLTPYELKVTFDTGTQIGSSGYNYLIEFLLPKVYYSRTSQPLTSGQIVKQSISGKSFSSSQSANDAVQVTYISSKTTSWA